MSKQYPGNFFEDFKLDQLMVHGTPRTITEGDMSLYIALTGSRYPLHCARPFAKELGLQRESVDDLLAFHIAFGKTVSDVSFNAVANLGYADVRFLKPVYPGDTLRSQSRVIGLKENSSGKNGNVYVRSTTYNQDGDAIMTWARWVMVHKRDHGSAAPEAVIPDLPDHVAVEDLPLPPGLDASGYDTAITGSPHLWDDYSAGERIDHVNGMTVDNSDHTLATKLYQNNARLHFEEHMMKPSRFGERLMYGGHVISLCRALSFNGLANAIGIAAINSGAHCNPAFAGDTFYAYSEVLDKWQLPGRTDLGALRLRTLGIKNMESEKIESPKIDVDGRQCYHENLVLDLDYTVLMPRRIS
ncbi:MAG: MaoC family dehydratase [Candidatus Sedimenticola sp. PURPLELP]